MFPFFRMLSNRLQCSVYSYEYTGYGASTGASPTELNTTHDIDAAWRRLVEHHKVPPNRIVVYGQVRSKALSFCRASAAGRPI
eukprot:SAG22_NODE_4319_length_1306_cov_0.870754_1_plen_83_part_00